MIHIFNFKHMTIFLLMKPTSFRSNTIMATTNTETKDPTMDNSEQPVNQEATNTMPMDQVPISDT